MRRALIPFLLLASLSAVGFQGSETFSLVHKHVLGETQTVQMTIEGKSEAGTFVSTLDLSSKVTEVAEDGAYTIEITTKGQKLVFNGEELPMEAQETPTSVQKFDAKGKLIRDPGEEEDQPTPMDVAFEYEPKAPVKIGETWTPEKGENEAQPLEWTLTGKEKVGEVELLVVEGKGKGPDDESIETKVWVDPVSFITRKAVTTIKGIKQEEGPDTEMTVTIEEKA